MRKVFAYLPLLVAVLTVVCGQGQSTPPKTPTQDDIQKMIDAKAYPAALRAISQAMPLTAKGDSRDYDKPTLLIMRGTCLMQMKDNYSAILAFEQAAKLPSTLAQNETALAMAMLIKKSPGQAYTPRNGDRTKIELSDAANVQRALAALLNDELPAVSARVAEVAKSQSLTPILAFAPTLRDLHAVEFTGTGDDKQTFALARVLGDRMEVLIGSELDRMGGQVQSIQSASSRVMPQGGASYQYVDGTPRWVPDEGATGLTANQRQTLRENIAYLGQIADTCDDLYKMARKYEREGTRWQQLAKSANDLKSRSTSLYENE